MKNEKETKTIKTIKKGKQVAEIYSKGKSYVAIRFDDENEAQEIEITNDMEEKAGKVYNGNKIVAVFNENGKLIDYFKA